ncbi:Signal recognition particle, SRP19 subunit [Sesbania bispinosa]|nr:Signal recognition particle, SRP19 subunit [Sesbania bispinosa]
MEGELANIKKWNVLYPVYINSKKTVAEGRRIGLLKACENPTCAEIGDCCSYLKLPFAIEIDKAYPRDFMQRGRMRVLLKKEDGTLYNSSIPSRELHRNHILLAFVMCNNLCFVNFFPTDGASNFTSSTQSRFNSRQVQFQLLKRWCQARHHGRTKKQEPASTSTAGPSNKSGKGGKKRR